MPRTVLTQVSAEAGLGAVGGDSLRPGLGEAAGLSGRDQQAQSVTAVPVPVPAGDVDGSDEGGAEANGVFLSGRSCIFLLFGLREFGCDAAYRRDKKGVHNMMFISVLREPFGFS